MVMNGQKIMLSIITKKQIEHTHPWLRLRKGNTWCIIIRNAELDGKDSKVADDFQEIDYTEVRMIN